MGDNAAEPAEGDTALRVGQGRAALQKNHLAAHEIRTACPGHMVQQRPPGRPDVVGQTVFSQGDVFRPGRGAGGLAEILRQAGPQHVVFAGDHPFHIALEPFVIPNGNRASKGLRLRRSIREGGHFGKPVVPTKRGVGGPVQELGQHPRLGDAGIGIARPVLTAHTRCPRPGKAPFPASSGGLRHGPKDSGPPPIQGAGRPRLVDVNVSAARASSWSRGHRR